MKNDINIVPDEYMITRSIMWLQAAFLLAKLTHFVDWSWTWVLSPLWICYGLGLLIVGISLIISIIFDGDENQR